MQRLEAPHQPDLGQGRGKGAARIVQLAQLQQQLDVVKAGGLVLGRQQRRLLQFVQAGLWVVGIGRIADLDPGDLGLQHVGRRQVFVEKGLDLPFRLRPHEAIGRLAIDHQHAGRDAANAKGLAQLLLLVGVDLDQFEAAGVLGLNFFQQRADHLARAAPGGPEVHQHGGVHRGIYDLGIEVFNGHIHHGNQLGVS